MGNHYLDSCLHLVGKGSVWVINLPKNDGQLFDRVSALKGDIWSFFSCEASAIVQIFVLVLLCLVNFLDIVSLMTVISVDLCLSKSNCINFFVVLIQSINNLHFHAHCSFMTNMTSSCNICCRHSRRIIFEGGHIVNLDKVHVL